MKSPAALFGERREDYASGQVLSRNKFVADRYTGYWFATAEDFLTLLEAFALPLTPEYHS